MTKLGDMPAFPRDHVQDHEGVTLIDPSSGMTYRQWLAGQIAVAWVNRMANIRNEDVDGMNALIDFHHAKTLSETAAKETVAYVDALIAELERP